MPRRLTHAACSQRIAGESVRPICPVDLPKSTVLDGPLSAILARCGVIDEPGL
jgi:hypothetical protein